MTRYLMGTCLLACLAFTPAWTAASFTELAIGNRMDYAFDAAGVLYVTAGSSVMRYDTPTGQYLTPYGIGGSLVGIDLSPDGQTLAVADATTQGANNRIRLVNAASGVTNDVSFVRGNGEAGTFMVAWGYDNRLLVTSSYSGSGWVPLRRYDPQNGSTTTVRNVRQDTMITSSADRRTIGHAESNISSGPIHAYDVQAGAIGASVDTGWFTFEVAVDRTGENFLAPTYGGGLVYQRDGANLTQATQLGQYADHGPIAGVFSPVADVLFTAEYDWSVSRAGVKVYDTETWTLLDTLDAYNFPWNGNYSMGEGRMEISPDGKWLAVSVENGVRLYDVSAWVPEPATGIGVLLAALAACRRRAR